AVVFVLFSCSNSKPTTNQIAHRNPNQNPNRIRKPTPNQKKLPGKAAHKYAHNRFSTPMGLDHRSVTFSVRAVS
ncbi:MAG TPA: hypothetical protein VII37_08160, partial [Candidatus Acidoferrum sp.]